jgi:dTDP-4-dehydrorhamnose reductase
MKILLLGCQGQLGWELQRSLSPLGELIALTRHSTLACGDLADLTKLAATVQTLKPDVVVNAAAYTAVDQAQTNAALAHQINTLGPATLARETAKLGAWLVHYSTDYVFDGSGCHAWREDDATAPLNVYGQTKREGEQLIQAANARHLILRTSWLYGAHGNNFAKTMLRLAQARSTLHVIADQIGAPTGADLVADVSAHALHQLQHKPHAAGLYHVSAAGETSWHGYTQYLLAQARQQQPHLPITATQVLAVPSSAFASAAQRPLNSRLASQKFQTTFALTLPAWQVGVARFVAQMKG